MEHPIQHYHTMVEEVLAEYKIEAERIKGLTGVWLDPNDKIKARKICAFGVRCSRWVTMHGFAFNVNTDLNYFNQIIPCGISDKSVTSLQRDPLRGSAVVDPQIGATGRGGGRVPGRELAQRAVLGFPGREGCGVGIDVRCRHPLDGILLGTGDGPNPVVQPSHFKTTHWSVVKPERRS